jgi:hypothetical protein
VQLQYTPQTYSADPPSSTLLRLAQRLEQAGMAPQAGVAPAAEHSVLGSAAGLGAQQWQHQ